MTVRRDCDKSERVFLQNIPHLLINTESLLSLSLFRMIAARRWRSEQVLKSLECGAGAASVLPDPAIKL